MGSDNDDIGEEMESIAYKSDSDVSLAQSAIMEGLKVKLHIDPRNMAYMGVSPRAIAYSKLKIIVFLIHMWVKHHQFQDVVKKSWAAFICNGGDPLVLFSEKLKQLKKALI